MNDEVTAILSFLFCWNRLCMNDSSDITNKVRNVFDKTPPCFCRIIQFKEGQPWEPLSTFECFHTRRRWHHPVNGNAGTGSQVLSLAQSCFCFAILP